MNPLSLPFLAAKATKPFVVRFLPRRAVRILRDSYYRYLRYRIRSPRLVGPIARSLGFRVQAGPFAGLLFPEEIIRADIESPILPKLVGSYELECQRFVEEICGRIYDQVINIGAGEGYYAVGVARRIPGARVIAFESHERSRELCAVLARLNGVEARVEVRGICDRGSLNASLHPDSRTRTIIICDCEGGELDLLQPDLIPGLRLVDLLIELHESAHPDISTIVPARFAATHRLEIVESTERDPDVYPALASLRGNDREFLVSEHRLHQVKWLYATSETYN